MNQVNIGSDNGLLLIQCQAIIWTSAGLLLIGPLGKNFILTRIQNFSLTKNASENIICEKMASLSSGEIS